MSLREDGSYEFRGFRVRPNMVDALKGYAEERHPVGHFLTAVLVNDLSEAVARADEDNLANLPAFIGYLYNEAPSPCWGSEEKVKKWLEKEGR